MSCYLAVSKDTVKTFVHSLLDPRNAAMQNVSLSNTIPLLETFHSLQNSSFKSIHLVRFSYIRSDMRDGTEQELWEDTVLRFMLSSYFLC